MVEWRERVAAVPPPRHRGETYWAAPVPGFGVPQARVLILGLAPAAHGGNRTGRIFTGDRSGDWLFAALHRAGFASQPRSVNRDDGLRLIDCYVSACVKCAPPGNRPLPAERDNCQAYLLAEIQSLDSLQAIVALGSFAWDGALRGLAALGRRVPVPRPVFGHLAETRVGEIALIGSYHPSQQNTFTGKLTEEAFDRVWERVGNILRGN